MITVFNRKEVYMGYSMDVFNNARNILDANKINYTYKFGCYGGLPTVNENGRCYLYVHEKDAERADFLLRDIERR